MSEGGFFEQKRRSPTSLTIVILLHGAALTALAMSKMDIPNILKSQPTRIKLIEADKDPPPVPEPRTNEKPKQESRIDTVDRQVPGLPQTEVTLPPVPETTLDADPLPPPPYVQPVDPPKPPPPVRIEARMDPRSEVQPPYPTSEQRANKEGSVTIRVLIGTDGRVKEAQMVRADSEAFYRATERHALRNWRFEPARIDGKPVESRKALTVHFQLT